MSIRVNIVKAPRGYRMIPGCLGYAVNRSGKVISCRIRYPGGPFIGVTPVWRKLKLLRHPQGYVQVHVRLAPGRPAKTLPVHRLVLRAFVGPRPPRHDACHKNGVHDDNRLSNLRWDTRSANMYDRVAHGYVQPSVNKNAKVTPALVRKIRSSTASCVALSEQYGVHWKTISRIRCFRSWKHVI